MKLKANRGRGSEARSGDPSYILFLHGLPHQIVESHEGETRWKLLKLWLVDVDGLWPSRYLGIFPAKTEPTPVHHGPAERGGGGGHELTLKPTRPRAPRIVRGAQKGKKKEEGMVLIGSKSSVFLLSSELIPPSIQLGVFYSSVG